MSLTSGFFNSLNGDRKYSAEQMSAIFDGIINDGVFANVGTAFQVLASSGTEISVGEGRAWFNSTWIHNDAVMLLTLDASEVLQDRYDAVVIEVDRSETVRDCSIKILKGTPSTTPQYPAITNNASLHQYPLAFISRKANSTTITQADIINCIGMDYCPYVTGVLQVQSMEKNVAQWEAEWDAWFAERTADMDELSGTWMEDFKADVEAWFETIKDTVGKDPAVELANQIIALEAEVPNKVDKSGDTMSGPLQFNKSSSNGTSSIDRDESATNYHGLWLKDTNAAGKQVGLRLCSGLNLFQILADGAWYDLYSKFNKPTPADIGALPTTGGDLSGQLNIKNTDDYVGLAKQRYVDSALYTAVMGVGSDTTRGASASVRLTNALGTVLGRIDAWSNGTLTYYDGAEYHDIYYENGAAFACGSYVGAGANGYSNVNSLSFPFKPKIIFVVYQLGDDQNHFALGVIPASKLNTSYVANGFTNNVYYDDSSAYGTTDAGNAYAKLSSDGKTVSWYSAKSKRAQMNDAITYYYYAIGL